MGMFTCEHATAPLQAVFPPLSPTVTFSLKYFFGIHEFHLTNISTATAMRARDAIRPIHIDTTAKRLTIHARAHHLSPMFHRLHNFRQVRYIRRLHVVREPAQPAPLTAPIMPVHLALGVPPFAIDP